MWKFTLWLSLEQVLGLTGLQTKALFCCASPPPAIAPPFSLDLSEVCPHWQLTFHYFSHHTDLSWIPNLQPIISSVNSHHPRVYFHLIFPLLMKVSPYKDLLYQVTSILRSWPLQKPSFSPVYYPATNSFHYIVFNLKTWAVLSSLPEVELDVNQFSHAMKDPEL